MGNFTLSVLRPSDLLVLDFEFVNMDLDAVQGRPPRLVRSDPAKPVLMIVKLPPQHIAEQNFTEDINGNLEDLVPLPVPSVAANPTRLVFSIPDSVGSIPLTLHELLAWAKYEQAVVRTALPDPPGTTFRPSLTQPASTETAIDLPYGLILAPDASAGWAHSVSAVVREGRTELWHTRLGTRRDGKVDETRMPAVRAITMEHGRTFADVLQVIQSNLQLSTSLNDEQRKSIAHASSDFALRLSNGTPYVPTPLIAKEIILSALGGWADLGWMRSLEAASMPREASRVAAWRHVVSMGRDQYVAVTEKGFLFPFGHRASLFMTSERKFKPSPAGGRTAYVVRRVHIEVDEPEKAFGSESGLQVGYAHDGREMPIKRVRITTLTIPDLDASAATGEPFFPVTAAGSDVRFNIEAEDLAGNRIDFAVPLMFVSEAQSPELVHARYNADARRRRAELNGQGLEFASGGQAARLSTVALQLTSVVPAPGRLPAGHPRFLPALERAEVKIPAVERLLGKGAVQQISFHRRYLEHGFDADKNRGEAFASVVPFDLVLPPTKSGGLAAPSFKVDGLSRSLGPVAQADSIAGGTFDPLQYFGAMDAKLLGAIDLKTLIQAVIGGSPDGLASQVPRLIDERFNDTVTTRYAWHPKVKRVNDPAGGPDVLHDPATALITTAQTALDIEVNITAKADGSPPVSSIKGTLSRFSLNLVNVVGVSFGKLHFESLNDRKMELRAEGVEVKFSQALRFLQQLAEKVPSRGFDGASLTVRPEGIAANYSLGIPTAGLGAFSLENIALSAELLLPFVDRPAGLRLSFSSREHPFLVTVSLIGGGGFLSIVLNTKDIEQIEGAIELGGNVTIDLVVVRANAHSMAGLYFGLTKDGNGKLIFAFAGYLRIGGAVELLGIVGISIDFHVELRFLPNPAPLGIIEGAVAVVIGAHVLMFSKTFSLPVTCTFDIKTGALTIRRGSFDQALTENDWLEYCQAFA